MIRLEVWTSSRGDTTHYLDIDKPGRFLCGRKVPDKAWKVRDDLYEVTCYRCPEVRRELSL